MTFGSRIVPNDPQNIKAHTMGLSSLKGPQAVEELLQQVNTEIVVNRY